MPPPPLVQQASLARMIDAQSQLIPSAALAQRIAKMKSCHGDNDPYNYADPKGPEL
jgi:hypothetical protein